MEYEAIECASVDELNRKVNKMISDGWETLGGISVSLSETDENQYFIVAQAMTRKVVGHDER